MVAANYNTVGQNFKDYCDRVSEDDETVIVTQDRDNSIVMISMDRYNEMLKMINNADYLYKMNRSINQARQGKVVVKTMEELEAMEDE